jgi:hypothetical protein
MKYTMVTLGAFAITVVAQLETLPSCGVSRSAPIVVSRAFSKHGGSFEPLIGDQWLRV